MKFFYIPNILLLMAIVFGGGYLYHVSTMPDLEVRAEFLPPQNDIFPRAQIEVSNLSKEPIILKRVIDVESSWLGDMYILKDDGVWTESVRKEKGEYADYCPRTRVGVECMFEHEVESGDSVTISSSREGEFWGSAVQIFFEGKTSGRKGRLELAHKGSEEATLEEKEAIGVYIDGRFVAGADEGTLRSLSLGGNHTSNSLYADKHHVYLVPEERPDHPAVVAPDFSSENVEVLGAYIKNDTKVLYYRAGYFSGYQYEPVYFEPVQEVDPQTFRFEEGLGYRDDNRYYLRHLRCGHTGVDNNVECINFEEKIDVGSLEIKDLSSEGSVSYKTLADSDSVFFIKNGYIEEVPGAESSSFNLEGKCELGYWGDFLLMRDANNVYSTTRRDGIVPLNVNSDTFVYFSSFVHTPWGGGLGSGGPTYFMKDKDNVYLNCGTKIEGLDPSKFSVIYDPNLGDFQQGFILYDGVEYGRNASLGVDALITQSPDSVPGNVRWIAK